MPDMQMTAGYTSVLLRVDLLLSFFCLVGEERQEVIIMDKTYEMDGAGCNDDKDTTCSSSRDGTGLYEIVKEDRGCTIVPLLHCLSLTHFDR